MKLLLLALALSSSTFAADVQFPAAMKCKTTTCFTGECDRNSLSFKAENGQIKDAKLAGEEQDGYFELFEQDKQPDTKQLLEPDYVTVNFGDGDTHDFFAIDLYVYELAKLAKGEVKSIHGKFYDGIEWGGYNVDSTGVIKCTAE